METDTHPGYAAGSIRVSSLTITWPVSGDSTAILAPLYSDITAPSIWRVR